MTSRNLQATAWTSELLTNVSHPKMQDTGSPDSFKVLGRGELQLAILIEMMRREGFEMMVSRRHGNCHQAHRTAQLMEPSRAVLTIDIPESFVGTVIERLGPQQGRDGRR